MHICGMHIHAYTVKEILFAKEKQRYRCREQIYGYQWGQGWMGWFGRLVLALYTLL